MIYLNNLSSLWLQVSVWNLIGKEDYNLCFLDWKGQVLKEPEGYF